MQFLVSSASTIGTTISLVAFLAVIALSAFRIYVRNTNEKNPSPSRLRLAELVLNRFKITTEGFNKSQKYAIALKELDYRIHKLIFLGFIVLVLSASLLIAITIIGPPYPPPISPSAAQPSATAAETAECREFDRLRKLGRSDVRATFAIAEMYEKGVCVKQDEAEAIKYYEYSANANNFWAYIFIGRLYSMGVNGEPPDYQQAIYYWNKAAERGEPRGYTLIGEMYLHGRGVQQSTFKAIEYYQRAAEAGDTRGITLIGHIYLRGAPLVPIDCKQAKSFFEEAWKKTEPRAATQLGRMQCTGECLGHTDFSLGRSYLLRAKELGDDLAEEFLEAGICPLIRN